MRCWGLVAVRTHGAEPALAREHQDRLREWVRAARAALRAALAAEAVQAMVGFGLATWLLVGITSARTGAHDAGAGLLAVYWALSLPMLGYELALHVQQVPAQRSLTLRLVEPLGAPEERERRRSPRLTRSGAAARRPATPCRSTCRRCGWSRRGTRSSRSRALAIDPGEHVAIVGPSGAGKSSLVGLLLGWHRPASGTVTVDGRALGLGGARGLAAADGVGRSDGLPVEPIARLPTSASGWRAAGRSRARDRAKPIWTDVARRLPQGAETPLGEAGGLLSGGEGQRVRFGRGVLRSDPALVILDEPFRGLARDQRAALLARARRRWSDATLLCVTHDIGETERFARVLVVADGQIVEDGAPDALRARAGVALRGAARRRTARARVVVVRGGVAAAAPRARPPQRRGRGRR